MCIILFAFNQHFDYPLILLANRDEYYDRPSLAAAYWEDAPQIYAGRDLVGNGTWLGVTKTGRFAAVTNYRDPLAPTGILSRGHLVADFLKSDRAAGQYLERVQTRSSDYSGFNLLVGEISSKQSEILYYSNRGGEIQRLVPGIYGLSNRLLDTPWPKIAKGKKMLTDLVKARDTSNKKFFEILSDEDLAEDKDLPATGVPYELEKAISATFIKTAGYGTRCSTVLKFSRDCEWSFEEKVFV